MKRFFASLATFSLVETIGRHPALALGVIILLGVGGPAVVANLMTPTIVPFASSNFNPNQSGATNNGLKPNGGTDGRCASRRPPLTRSRIISRRQSIQISATGLAWKRLFSERRLTPTRSLASLISSSKELWEAFRGRNGGSTLGRRSSPAEAPRRAAITRPAFIRSPCQAALSTARANRLGFGSLCPQLTCRRFNRSIQASVAPYNPVAQCGGNRGKRSRLRRAAGDGRRPYRDDLHQQLAGQHGSHRHRACSSRTWHHAGPNICPRQLLDGRVQHELHRAARNERDNPCRRSLDRLASRDMPHSVGGGNCPQRNWRRDQFPGSFADHSLRRRLDGVTAKARPAYLRLAYRIWQ